MSFLTYLRVTYTNAIPRSAGTKQVLLRLLVCLPYVIVMAVCFADCEIIWALGGAMFMVQILYGVAFKSTRPSLYCLYPVRPVTKAIYEFFGSFLAGALMGVWIILFVHVIQLFTVLFVIMATGASFAQAVATNVMFAQLADLFSGGFRLYGLILCLGVLFVGFGSAAIFNNISSKALSRAFIAIFLVLNTAILALLMAFSVHSALLSGSEAFALWYAIPYLPNHMVYIWLYFAAGIVLTAISLILSVRSARR